jgi:Flp pilus assembly protein TadD
MTFPNDKTTAATATPATKPPRTGFLAGLRSSRALRKAFKAWGRGSLDEAQALLERAEGAVPGSLGALFLLARVLAEKGELERALSLIGQAIALRPEGPVPYVFRAMILMDLGREGAARDELERFRDANLLARAFCSLLDLKEKIRLRGGTGQVAVKFPLPARWIAHVSGRLLALLEEEYLARRKAEAMEFHCSLFEPKGPAVTREDEGDRENEGDREKEVARQEEGAPEGKEEPPAGPPPRGEASAGDGSERAPPRSRRECQRAVEDAFRARRHEEVALLCRDGGPCAAWLEPGLQVLHALSLLCLDKDQRASPLLAKCLRESPSSADFHFLQGLCHARKGQLSAAGWSFCRAARLADVDVDHVTQEIITKLSLQILFEG